MPGRVQWEDLDRAGRAKVTQLADRAPRPAPARARSARQPAAPLICHTCSVVSASLAAAQRHADTYAHRRIDTDLGYPPRCEHCGSAELVIRPNQSHIVPGRPVRLRVYCRRCGELDWIER